MYKQYAYTPNPTPFNSNKPINPVNVFKKKIQIDKRNGQRIKRPEIYIIKLKLQN